MNKLWITLPLSLLLLSGCQTSGDPSEGGLLGGLQGVVSGGYDERLREREERLQAEQQAEGRLSEQSAQLDKERRAAELALKHEQDRLKKLNGDVKSLERRIAILGKDADQNEGDVKALQQRLKSLKQDLAKQGSQLDALEGDGTSTSDLRRSQLEAQRRALQREYETLLELTLQLAQ